MNEHTDFNLNSSLNSRDSSTQKKTTYINTSKYTNCRGDCQIIRVMTWFYFTLFTSLPLQEQGRKKRTKCMFRVESN